MKCLTGLPLLTFFSFIICYAFAVPLATSRDVNEVDDIVVLQSRAPTTPKTTVIQMFEWTWDSVAAECTEFIGPAGYGFVQGTFLHFLHCKSYLNETAVSPPQEHIQGPQWWTDYQPVSYILTSKRGDRTQFANMINTCHTAGVGVIVGMSYV